jgi:hypothetical protein
MDYMEGNLEPNQKTLVNDHLANCPRCRQEFERIHDIWFLLNFYNVEDPGEAFWDSLSSRIYSRVNSEELAQKKPWEIFHDWMSWKRLVYTATPILLILLLIPTYHLYQSHFLKLTHQENVLTVEEIGNGFFSIEESLVQLPANQLDKLQQEVAGLVFDTQILAVSGFLNEMEWDINEEISQMHKEKLKLLVKNLKVQYL